MSLVEFCILSNRILQLEQKLIKKTKALDDIKEELYHISGQTDLDNELLEGIIEKIENIENDGII